MDYLGLISSGAKEHIAPHAQRTAQAKRDKEAALIAEARHKAALSIQTDWLSALADDALLIAFGQPMPMLANTLNSAKAGLIFVMYGLIDEINDRQTMDTILGTILNIQTGTNEMGGDIPLPIAQKIGAGIETARIALRTFKPIQTIQAANTFEQRHPNLVAHAQLIDIHERAVTARKTLTAKKHLVTFGQ